MIVYSTDGNTVGRYDDAPEETAMNTMKHHARPQDTLYLVDGDTVTMKSVSVDGKRRVYKVKSMTKAELKTQLQVDQFPDF